MSIARWLETDSLTNQSIAAATAVGAYTADADRMIVCDVSLDQVAGNGDYVIYVTRQIGGAGSVYVLLPKTTCAAASGETAIAMQSGMVSVRSGDVLTCYVDGLAGDTTTPDTTVRWFEVAALRPTTADRTLDVSAGGEAGVDWSNVGSPTTTINLSGTSTKANEIAPLDAAGTRAAVGLSAANLDSQLSAVPAAVVAAMDADPPNVNVAQISGDTTAADNLEAILDGTGGIDIDLGQVKIVANVSGEGALDITNAHASGYGTHNTGNTAVYNAGVSVGQDNYGFSSGQYNHGNLMGQNNNAASGDDIHGDMSGTVNLADDAITAAKFDESTAFPLAQADTGSTAVARTGADSDTLETLSDAIDGVGGSGLTAQETANAVHNLAPVGTPAAGSIGDKLDDLPATILTTAVAAYAGTPGTFGYLLSLLAGLDFTAVNLVAASNAGEITIKRTLTLAAVVSGLTIPADWTACYWTVKRSTDDADADALVQILVSNPADGDDGLLVLMGATVDDQTAGSLTVNQALGTVTIALDDASTAALEDAVELVWDVKVHAPAGKTQPGAGTATITTAVTRT